MNSLAFAERDHRAACLSLLAGHTRQDAFADFRIAGGKSPTTTFVVRFRGIAMRTRI